MPLNLQSTQRLWPFQLTYPLKVNSEYRNVKMWLIKFYKSVQSSMVDKIKKKKERNPNVQIVKYFMIFQVVFILIISFNFFKLGEIVNIRTESRLTVVSCSSHLAGDKNRDQKLQPSYCTVIHSWTDIIVIKTSHEISKYFLNGILSIPTSILQFF